jgi:glucosamine 6-phosphate synthetase-like amidotransferase/phosphosugar isomerase protein
MQIKKGEAFVSETDTEVIPKLCNYIYSSSQERVPFHEVCLQCPFQDICKFMQSHLLSLIRRICKCMSSWNQP